MGSEVIFLGDKAFAGITDFSRVAHQSEAWILGRRRRTTAASKCFDFVLDRFNILLGVGHGFFFGVRP